MWQKHEKLLKQHFIYSIAKEIDVIYDVLFIPGDMQGSQMWIGLHCLRQNNWFEWVSGDVVRYVNWNRREPNDAGSNEHCVHLVRSVSIAFTHC